VATDHETRHRAIRATKIITQLRLDVAELLGADPDASDLLVFAIDLNTEQWHALGERAGISPPSEETINMVHVLLEAVYDIEERYSTLPSPGDLLKSRR
jgi:hypothetical protein